MQVNKIFIHRAMEGRKLKKHLVNKRKNLYAADEEAMDSEKRMEGE
ncbi:MAG TPA: hypothetical protein PKH33_06630 [bacterium]|nr:hypothetical protein [bacterium]